MKVCGLRTENKIRPIDITVEKPAFRWRVETEEENWRQKEYRIVVRNERKTVWDSGFIRSAQMTNVPYQGEALVSDERYFWYVECVSSEGEIASGEETWFETGLFCEEDWKGIYIGEKEDHVYHIFRKEFEIEKEVVKIGRASCRERVSSSV